MVRQIHFWHQLLTDSKVRSTKLRVLFRVIRISSLRKCLAAYVSSDPGIKAVYAFPTKDIGTETNLVYSWWISGPYITIEPDANALSFRPLGRSQDARTRPGPLPLQPQPDKNGVLLLCVEGGFLSSQSLPQPAENQFERKHDVSSGTSKGRRRQRPVNSRRTIQIVSCSTINTWAKLYRRRTARNDVPERARKGNGWLSPCISVFGRHSECRSMARLGYLPIFFPFLLTFSAERASTNRTSRLLDNIVQCAALGLLFTQRCPRRPWLALNRRTMARSIVSLCFGGSSTRVLATSWCKPITVRATLFVWVFFGWNR